VASLTLNGVLIGWSDNMFRQYTYTIKDVVNWQTNNTLLVTFQSPTEYATRMYEKQSQDYIVPPQCPLPTGDCHANHIRKMQSSFR
jgi:beta-mannosidase